MIIVNTRIPVFIAGVANCNSNGDRAPRFCRMIALDSAAFAWVCSRCGPLLGHSSANRWECTDCSVGYPCISTMSEGWQRTRRSWERSPQRRTPYRYTHKLSAREEIINRSSTQHYSSGSPVRLSFFKLSETCRAVFGLISPVLRACSRSTNLWKSTNTASDAFFL